MLLIILCIIEICIIFVLIYKNIKLNDQKIYWEQKYLYLKERVDRFVGSK